jgi:NACHT domain
VERLAAASLSCLTGRHIGRQVWQSAIVSGAKRPYRPRRLASGRHPSRGDGAVAVALFLLPWVVGLALALSRHSDLRSATVAILVSAALGLPVLWLAWAAYRGARGSATYATGLTMAQVADQLAVAVGAQWKAEAAIRRLNDPYPLPVSWAPADASLADSWDSLVRLARSGAGWPPPPPSGIWAAGPDDLAGAGGDIVEVLARVPTGRLVVLGEPGAGKTMLMVRLVLDLLARRAAGDRVPILASLASWNPADQDLREWMCAQLMVDYPALATRSPSGGQGSTQAAVLLASGLVIPILDGLDELAPSLRSTAIARINESLRPGEPIVVASRTEEFVKAIRPPSGKEATLRGAAAVQLRPLDVDAVRGYLGDDATGAAAKARWEPVFKLLGTEAPVGHVLASPLMVGLARATYSSRPGHPPRDLPDPAELSRLPDETAVERRLWDGFIATAYQPRWSGRWPSTQADRWLVFIARHLQHLGVPELAWWQLPMALHRQRRMLALLGGVIIGLVLFIVWLVLGLMHGLFAPSKIGSTFIAIAILTTIPALIASLVLRLREARPPEWLRLGTPVRLPGGVLHSLLPRRLFRQPDIADAASPIVALRRARYSALLNAAIAGYLGVIGLVIVRVLVGRFPFVVAVVAVGYVAVLSATSTVWGNYQIAHFWLATRRKLPFFLFAFLADAQYRGFLLTSGAVYEFRHVLLQNTFADPARTPDFRKSISELTDWALANPEIKDAYVAVGADRSDIEYAVNSVVSDSLSAGQDFKIDVAVRQEVLERIRLRLNDLGRRSLFDRCLKARRAPGLGAVLDPAHVVLTDSMTEVERLAKSVSSASIGVSGVRGVGKSTLIRWICEAKDGTRRFPTLGLYVSAPVEYDARDFLIHLYTRLCQVVLADDRLAGQDRDWKNVVKNHAYGIAASVLIVVGVAAVFHSVSMHLWSQYEPSKHTRLPQLIAAAAFTAAAILAYFYYRHLRADPNAAPVDIVARERLRRLQYQITETTGRTGTLSGAFGLTLAGSRSRALTENQMTLPELVADYRLFAERVVSSLQNLVPPSESPGDLAPPRDSPAAAQARLVVGIDEIDRIENAEQAEKFLNEIKAIFGVPSCFYVASLSADALATFERRAITARTAFETAFDTMVRIGPMNLRTARELLERRAIGLPYPFVALCHVLSGGVPRELMRVARSVFDIRNSGDNAREDAVDCRRIAREVIARELGSVRQGLLPLADQTAARGAAGLMELLDDREWPTGDLERDLTRISRLPYQREDFIDANGAVTTAVNICDSFMAATFLFITVQEIFSLRLDDLVKDLIAYDSMTSGSADAVSNLQLLVRARTVLAINPSLAVNHVRGFRRSCNLTSVTPVLVSQAMSTEGQAIARGLGSQDLPAEPEYRREHDRRSGRSKRQQSSTGLSDGLGKNGE